MLHFVLLAPVFAAEVCEEVKNMMAIGLPESAVVESLAQINVTREDVDCLTEAGVPASVLEVARARQLNAPPTDATGGAPRGLNGPSSEESGQQAAGASAGGTLTGMPDIAPALRARPPAPGCSETYLLATLPDPGAAAALSGFIGFGAGSFYARRPLPGVVALAPQLIGWGLIGLQRAPGAEVSSSKVNLGAIGGSMVVLGRMADVGLATGAAHRTRLEAVEACGY